MPAKLAREILLDIDFGGGYFLDHSSKGGSLAGFSLQAAHRIDLRSDYTLRIGA